MTSRPDFRDWMAAIQARVESALGRALPAADHEPRRLHAAMRYAVLGGGKRVRPLLAFAAGEATGAAPERLDAVACAVELVHAYSLVHDDLPCMDDDVLRRGKPTVHVEFDQATALLAGDGLQSAAFEALGGQRLADDPHRQVEMLHTLAVAAGTRGMAGGQAMDLAAVGRAMTLPELELMHIMKTGALIRASVMLGAQCGAPRDGELARLDHYAKCVGLAFQVVDDVLDAEGSTATLGKTAGKDAAQRKPTYVSLLDVARAKELAQALRRDAHQVIADFGPRARRLADLADFIVTRQF